MEGVPIIPGVWWMFDGITYVFLLGGAVLIIELLAKRLLKGRHMPRSLAVALLLVSWGVVFWGSFIESRMLTVEESTIALLPDGDQELRVAVVADFHTGPYKKDRYTKRVVEQLNALDVELVLIPGDFIFHKTNEVEWLYPLADLRHPAYAVLGNHDHHHGDVDYITEYLEELGLVMLRNAYQEVETSAGPLTIAGIDDVWFGANPVSALEGAPGPIILISHNPDIILDPYADRADLILAGHTHCGQIRLPILGPVPPLPTQLGRSWDCGLFELSESRHLFITPGVGETGPRARLFNPPQIDLVTLTL